MTGSLKTLSPFLTLALLILSIAEPTLAQTKLKKKIKTSSLEANPVARERIDLERAIQKALLNNRGFMQAKLGFRNQELSYDNAWDTFFLPQVSISAQLSNNYTIGQFKYAGAETIGPAAYNHGYPTGGLTLNLGRYTLFNFWRDWLQYETARLQWQRAREQIQETERALRFNVIVQLYAFKIQQEKLDAANRSLNIADAIVAYLKSGLRSGKANESEYQSAVADLMMAKNERDMMKSATQSALWNMNQTLGDPLNTEYEINVKFKSRPLKVSPDEAYAIYLDTGPSVKNARLGLRSAELGLESAEKSALPLPTITFSGVTISYSNGYYGGQFGGGTDAGANFEIGGSVGITIPILGPGGLFNRRTVEAARISRDQAEISYIDSLNNDRVQIYSQIQSILQAEQAMENNRQRFESAQSVLDSLYAKLNTGLNRLELRDALNQAREAEFQLLESQVNHIQGKIQLALALGVDNLPGDTFE